MSSKYIIFWLVIITLIGGGLRIFPVEYASMEMYDTQLVTQAFDLGKGFIKGDFSALKTPVKYPYFFSYILLFFYGLFYFIGKLMGLFFSAGEFINYIFFHLDSFYDFARILIGIFGTALIPLVYITVSKVLSFKDKANARTIAMFVSFLMAFNLLHIHISHQERPHILVSFFIFLSFYCFVLFLEKRTLICSLFLGISIGLTAGSLQNGLIAILFFVLILVFTKFKCFYSAKFWIGILGFLIIFIFCYPYLILSFAQSIYSETGSLDFTFSGEIHKTQSIYSFAGRGFEAILRGFIFYQPILTLLFLFLFLSYFIFKKRNSEAERDSNPFYQSVIGGGCFVVLYGFIFGMYNATYLRMLTPLTPFFCLFIALLLNEFFYNINIKRYKKIFIGVLILFLIFPLIQALRFNYLMFKEETRDLARTWIENNISKSNLIAIDNDIIRFIPTKKDLQFQMFLEPDSLSRKDEFLINLEDEIYPEGSRSILRFWVFRYKKDIYQFLKKQEVKYFITSKSNFADNSERDLDFKIISSGGELINIFSPFAENNSSRYSTFPNEFINPIMDLWAIERMGPIIEIYKL